jgi:uncharacterized damage-inducible protein DinB
MKSLLLMYAHYSRRADESVGALLKSLDMKKLNEKGRTFCGSLIDLYRHIASGVTYFQGMIRASIPQAVQSLPESPEPKLEENSLNAEELKVLITALSNANQAVVDFITALPATDFSLPVNLDWYPDRKSVPLHFILNQLFVHGIHHRGQISQLLDEFKVEHDFSGIDLEYMPE